MKLLPGVEIPSRLRLHFPGVGKDEILLKNANGSLATSLSKDGLAPVALEVEAKQNEAVFIISPDVKAMTKTGQSFPCSFFNTFNQCPRLASPRFVSHITFARPKANLIKPPYSPFIFSTLNRGIETHLVNLPPTSLANPSYFGTGDDASDPSTKSYYTTADNLPWALDIPDNWLYPSEKEDITLGYSQLKPWAESKGVKNTGWYLTPSDVKHIYTRK